MDDLTRKQEPQNVYLKCGHQNSFWPPPNLDDLVYCWKCDDWRRVTGGNIHRQIKRLKCEDCNFSRDYIMSLDHLRIRAETHMLRYGHTVKIWDENGKVRSVIPYGPKVAGRSDLGTASADASSMVDGSHDVDGKISQRDDQRSATDLSENYGE